MQGTGFLQQLQLKDRYTSSSMDTSDGFRVPRFLADNRKRYFVFDSRERDSPLTTNPNNCSITLNETLSNIKSMALEYFSMPNLLYNIATYLGNNVLQVTQGGLFTITMQDGAYDANNLFTYLAGLLSTTTGNAWTCTFDPITYKVTFTSVVPFSIDFTFPNSSFLELGFNAGITPLGLSATGANPFQLQGITEIYIDFADYESTMFDISLSANFVVPIDTNFGGQIVLQYNSAPNNFAFFNNYSNKLNRFHIRILDTFGRALQLNGARYEMCVSFTYYD